MKTVSPARLSKPRLSKPRFSKPSKSAPPLRLTPALCKTLAVLACLWLASTPRDVRAADRSIDVTTSGGASEAFAQGALMKLQTGKTLTVALPDNAKYRVEGPSNLVKTEALGQMLLITALRSGNATLIIETPGGAPQNYLLRIAGERQFAAPENLTGGANVAITVSAANPTAVSAPRSTPTTINVPLNAQAQGRTPGHTSFAATTASGIQTTTSRAAKDALKNALQTAPSRLAALQITRPNALMRVAKAFAVREVNVESSAPDADRIVQPSILASAQVSPDLPEIKVIPRGARPTTVPGGGFSTLETPAVSPGQSAVPGTKSLAAAPAETSPANARSASAAPAPETSDAASSEVTTTSEVPPPRMSPGSAPFPMESALPSEVARMASEPTAKRPLYRVTSGMARVMAFRSNILAVFFSDENIMDARAINARTLAVTGKGAGKSTLAVFLSRFAGDVVGRAVIYNIEVYPSSGHALAPAFTDPAAAEAAIRTAINDPRVRVSVIQRPDGILIAQLAGGLRDKAEVDAAVTTAALFVPNVIPSLYVDPKASTLEESLREPALIGEPLLQSQLRSIFGNDTIELIPLPGGTALKGVVSSAAEAETLLSILPTLGRQIQPFIVIRGTEGNRIYTSERPILYGEDYEMTRRLNEVTGISTVYAVRSARNALAIYGTVRNRAEFETIRRYANILPQLQEAVATTQQAVTQTSGSATLTAPTTTATTTSVAATAPALSAAAGLAPAPTTAGLSGLTEANAPAGAYKFPIQVQMFVRVLDDSAASVRLVTVESSVVEIRRDAAQRLGAQFGSATLLSSGTGGATVGSEFNLGEGLFGDFGGTGTLSNINPLRVSLSALLQNGSLRVLSKPNLTAVEGATAQITIGGVRPVPQVTATGAAGGSSQTNIVFRRFGIILSMRPTVTDDDTIILQIRADVTNLDPTIAVTIAGAVIPGESVRSVDTTVTLREGDTLVLGGLITNEHRKQTTKVPILGDIPIIGSLFRSKNFENNETELAIFLTPRMLRQRISPNGQNAVSMIPSFPGLPSLQDQQSNAFGLSSVGEGGSGQQ
jgi:Flp pilus assembly secretin CpaC